MDSFWETLQITLESSDNRSAGRFFVTTNVFAEFSLRNLLWDRPKANISRMVVLTLEPK